VNLNRGLTLEGYLERLRRFARRVKSTRRRVIVLHEEDPVISISALTLTDPGLQELV
jgi:hypothetical protein